MVKIGNLTLDKPRIAVSISDKEDNKVIKSLNADILEIRLDHFHRLDPEHIKDSILSRKKSGFPLILTIRSKKEGGRRNVPDKLKFRIFEDTITLIDAIDIELNSPIVLKVIALAKKNKKLAIVSWHNFRSTPNNRTLVNMLNRAKQTGAHIVKIAAKAKGQEDVIRLMQWTLNNKAKNIITISLGNTGAISRLLFPMLGSLITYSYIDKPSGSGQLPLEILQAFRKQYLSQMSS